MSEDSRPSGGPTAADDVEDVGEGTSSSHASTQSGDEDEEDEEPTLRYSRIQSQPLAELFSRGDTCSSLALSDKYLVLGTHNGGVVILARPGQATDNAASAGTSGHARAASDKRASYFSASGDTEDDDNEETEGQKVLKRYKPHQASVMAIVIDEESQFVGTASTDGKQQDADTVVIY
jgi:hypothetical protein